MPHHAVCLVCEGVMRNGRCTLCRRSRDQAANVAAADKTAQKIDDAIRRKFDPTATPKLPFRRRRKEAR